MNCKHYNIDRVDDTKSYCKDCGEEFVKEMTEPKLISRRVSYTETAELFDIEINKKVVRVEKYNKQDALFNDYEFEIDVVDKDKVLTEEEHDEVYEFVEGLG